MDALRLEKTDDSPQVILDPAGALFEISGKSLPEDAVYFYQPILDWLSAYRAEPLALTKFNLKLIYFNTASSKLIMDILLILEEMVEEGHEGKLAFLGIFARTTITPNNELQELLEEEYGSYLDTYVSAFSNALPHLSRNEVAVRVDYALGAMAHALSDPGRRAALGATDQALNMNYIMKTLRAFLIGGLTAAPSDSASRRA